MATSGITTNQLTRNQFIEAGLRTLGVLALDQTPEATMYTTGLVKLNALLGTYRTLGMSLWARSTQAIPLTASTSSYTIGSSQTVNTPYPIHLYQAYRVDTGSDVRIPMEIVPNFNYNLFPATAGGRPIQITYQPKINQGVIQVWPTPDTDAETNSTVYIVYQRPFEYFNASTDTLDMPEEWVLPLIYDLAVLMAPEYGIPLQDRSTLMKEAAQYRQAALDNGTEDGALFFQPYMKP